MASNTPLTIAYGGTLAGFSNKQSPTQNNIQRQIKNLIWTYNAKYINQNTRSGYYILQAISKLVTIHNISPNQLNFNLWGNIHKENEQQVMSLGLSKYVSIQGYCTKEENLLRLHQSDVLFLPLETGIGDIPPLFIPGKLYEYLAIGKPILGLMEASDCRDILLKSGLGITASPFSIEEIYKTLLYLIENKDNLGKLFEPNNDFIAQFDSKHICKKMAILFDNILSTYE